jgi:ribonuclease P protein component
VKRRFSVRDDQRFREIRQRGRAYTSDLLVLCALPNELSYSRFGFAVNSRIGNAVVRNRIKRRLREIMRLRMARIRPGWDIICIARRPIRSADYLELEAACARLLRRAHLLAEDDSSVITASGQNSMADHA